MEKKLKKKVRLAIVEWNCFGHFSYGQGRGAAEFGEEIGQTAVCHKVCNKSDACRAAHMKSMDEEFPAIAKILRDTIASVAGTSIQLVPLVVSAMNVAVRRNNPEALRIQEGLKSYGVGTMTDHYIYGQLRNLNNGLNKKPADAKPELILVGASLT